MQTGRYRAVPPIGVVSAPLPPKSASNGRFRPLPPAVGRYQSREKEEEGEPGDPTLLSVNAPNPSPTGFSTRLHEENKLWRSRGEETRVRSLSDPAFLRRGAPPTWGEAVCLSIPFGTPKPYDTELSSVC
ncbi:hypothetical protein BHE74_00004329 [Ensete ventricosum]|nr:hypothetical protein BHE74_00004329 [Ensete ventricosum]